jgi:hypothetical protein
MMELLPSFAFKFNLRRYTTGCDILLMPSRFEVGRTGSFQPNRTLCS